MNNLSNTIQSANLDSGIISHQEIERTQIVATRRNWKEHKSLRWVGDSLVNSRDRWKNLRVLRLRHHTREGFLPPLPHNLILIYKGQPSRQETLIDGKNLNFLQTPNSITVTPAFQTMFSRYDDTEQDDIYLHITQDFLLRIAEGMDLYREKIELKPVFCAEDQEIEMLGALAVRELQKDDTQVGGEIFADAIATALSVHLLRNYSASDKAASLQKNFTDGLPPQILKKVTDYIDANLCENLSLSEVAKITGMSEFHFLRMFKKSMNQSPHQYIVNRRVERARWMLKETKKSITEIAYELGFSSSSHLCTTFSNIVGSTPTAYRSCVSDNK